MMGNLVMTHKKALFGLCILLMSMALFTVSGFAQDDGTDSDETPLRGQVNECMEARLALRQAGIEITQDNLPEGCAPRSAGLIERLRASGRERAQQFAACLEAIQELRNAGQRVTREEALELEECAPLNTPRNVSVLDRQPGNAGRGRYGQLGEQRSHQREERALQPGERMPPQSVEGLAQEFAECREAIRELRDAGQQVTRDNLPEVCNREPSRQNED